MKTFLEKNKIPIAIVIASVIIAAAIWLSVRPPANPDRTPPATEQSSELPQAVQPTSIRISYTQAPDYVGKYVCVTGIVDHVYTSQKGTVFLNFCPDYKSCPFGAVIFGSNTTKFPSLRRYTGRKIEITGFITLYQNRPEIILESPAQIKLAQ
jgi:DNA/RNA endonuclease YhcR with UshA esterase domain